MHGTLFVAREDMGEFCLIEGIVEVENSAAGIAKDDGDFFTFQACDHSLCTSHMHRVLLIYIHDKPSILEGLHSCQGKCGF